MNSYGIKDTVIEYINSEKPFLGICLGLQLLFPESEESPNVKGLSVFDGTITKIPSGEGLKIPHIGWNSLKINEKRFSENINSFTVENEREICLFCSLIFFERKRQEHCFGSDGIRCYD
jgi:imidazoleglycerol phosphate synthase glutamine amidotransferase subunit HisH